MAQASQYPYSLVRRLVNTSISGRLTNLRSGDTGDTNIERDLINRAVRIAISEIDFRGNKREQVLTPNLSDSYFDYDIPNDVKADKIVDLRPQVTDTRDEFETYDIVTPEEFDRRKAFDKGIATIVDDELTRRLRVSADIETSTLEVDKMEDTGWTNFSANSVNDSDVKVDEDDYTKGNASIRFQTDTSDSTDSTIGIQHDSIGTFDISPYKAHGSVFVDGKITTYDTGIHSLSVRLGSDSNNYYELNDSNQNDCSAFESGWNRVRLNMSNRTTTGTPTDTAITYAAIFWNRDTTDTAHLHTEDTDWHFDNLFLKRGKYYLLSYYSRFVWQDSALALSENSTHDTHALMVQNDELEVIIAKASELASGYLRDKEEKAYFAGEYQRLKQAYLNSHPSEARVKTGTYYNFRSFEDYYPVDHSS